MSIQINFNNSLSKTIVKSGDGPYDNGSTTIEFKSSNDAKEIITAKLKEAQKTCAGEILVEDTSLYFEGLNGLPGPLIKWFMKSIGVEGLFNLVNQIGNNKAKAVSIFGYINQAGDVSFYEGNVDGTIVAPTGSNGFGWDSIFKPTGSSKTFAEMSTKEKSSERNNMRRRALEKLVQAINNK